MFPFVSGRPPGGGGVTDHGALSGLLDDDHTQYALLAGRAGGQTLKGGINALDTLTLQSTSHATRSSVQIEDWSTFRMLNPYGHGIGAAVPPGDAMLYLRPAVGGSVEAASKFGIVIGPQWNPSANDLSFMGLSGNALVLGIGRTGLKIYGLDFQAIAAGGDYTNAVGCQARSGGSTMAASTVASQDQFRARSPTAFKAGSVVTALAGFHAEAQGDAAAASVYGLLVDDITAGTARYLAWLGPSTSRFQVNAGTPGAGQTMVYIAEGVTPTVRRLQVMDPGAGGASFAGGENVCILV